MQVSYGERSVNSVGVTTREVDDYMPWWRYRNTCLTAGMTLADARTSFTDAVNSGGVQAMFVRNEWCVCLFMGVTREVERREALVIEELRQKQLDDTGDLTSLRQGGDRMLEGHLGAIVAPLALGSSSAPICDASVADQPVLAPAPQAFRTAMTFEVDYKFHNNYFI